MTDLLLKLFGVQVKDAQNVVGRSLSFHGLGLGWVLLLAIVLGALVVWMYRRAGESIPPARRHILTALRTLFILLILGLLLRPVLAFTVESGVRRSLAVLIDVSRSMSSEDRRTDEADLKRVAIARGLLDPAKGLEQPLEAGMGDLLTKVPRLDVLKAALSNKRIDLLPRLMRDYDVSVYAFDRGLSPLATQGPTTAPAGSGGAPPWLDALTPRGAVTAIGDNIQDIIATKRGQPLAGIVLVTDGASNSGSPPLAAAAAARQSGFPLFTYGVGIANPRDIIVAGLLAQEVAFTEDEVPVTVTVRSQHLEGESAKILLKLVDDKGLAKTVDEQEVKFGADSEQTVSLKFTPKIKGQFDLRAEIAPRDDEIWKNNNSAAQPLRVVEEKLRVLLIEQQPRWEFKYLQAMLQRDRRIESKCLLIEADKAVLRQPDSPYLDEFPAKEEDLAKYHLIVLGDMDLRNLSAQNVTNLVKFVSEHGGSLVLLAGRRHNPNDYRGTPLEKLLPVELADPGAPEAVADKPIKLRLTALGKSSTMLRMAEKDQDSQRLWADLPAVYWVNRVTRAKPGAEVLIVDPDDTKKHQNKEYMPVMAVQQYGVGQVLYVGTDNTWRWRKNAGDRYYTMLWGQITYRMSLPSILRGSKTTQLTATQDKYITGERVTVYARLYSKTFQPLTDKTVKGWHGPTTAPASERREVTLSQIPDQPGRFKGEFTAGAPGVYQFVVDGREKESAIQFQVDEPRNEWGDTAMNESLLKLMAADSGGMFFREENLHKLPEALAKGADRVRSTIEFELWSSPLYFVLMLLVVTAEWILRKLTQLK